MKKPDMRRLFAAICLLLTGCIACSACGKTERVRDYSCFYGLCEVSAETQAVERSLTNDFISDMAGGLGVRSFRLWMSLSDIIDRESYSDSVRINAAQAAAYHDLIDKLSAQGVTRFVAMSGAWIYPYDYPCTTFCCIPDPQEEYDSYIRFLSIQEECYRLLAAEFSEIEYFEPGNEPDNESGQFMHKNNFTYGGSVMVNAEYMYTPEELSYIIADMCYYAGRGVRQSNPDAKIVLPGLCNYNTTPDFLDGIYSAIESRALPAGETYADTDPDNYFQILNWHPYVLTGSGDLSEEWVLHQQEIYAVAERHGDGDKAVWYTEMGWSDRGDRSMETVIADRFIDLFERTRSRLPFVEAVFLFRISTLAESRISQLEDNFGLIVSPLDEQRPGEPKPAALAIAQYIRGENCDLSLLYKYVPEEGV